MYPTSSDHCILPLTPHRVLHAEVVTKPTLVSPARRLNPSEYGLASVFDSFPRESSLFLQVFKILALTRGRGMDLGCELELERMGTAREGLEFGGWVSLMTMMVVMV